MKQNARADVPRLYAKASHEARSEWERNVDFENLGSRLMIAEHIKAAMKALDPKSDEWWKLKARLDATRAEIRGLRIKLYGKWLAIFGFTVAVAVAFGAGLLLGWALCR